MNKCNMESGRLRVCPQNVKTKILALPSNLT
jgi:hypothetical protein